MSPLLRGLAFVVLAPLLGALAAGLDRRLSARLQGRLGPPLLQPLFDVHKLLEKAPRAVNALAGPLLLGHVGFMALTGALLVGGADVLFSLFVFVLAALCLALAAGSADSPYSAVGAERELVLVLAAEPFLVLLLAGVCKLTGASTLPEILASPVPVAARFPGAVLVLLLVALLKLRKSPFDLSASHHAHQELGRGLTSDLAGPQLALVEVAHWYETAILFGLLVPMLFNWSLAAGAGAALGLYLLAVLVDCSTGRARWQLVLRTTWVATLVLSGANLFALYLW